MIIIILSVIIIDRVMLYAFNEMFSFFFRHIKSENITKFDFILVVIKIIIAKTSPF